MKHRFFIISALVCIGCSSDAGKSDPPVEDVSVEDVESAAPDLGSDVDGAEDMTPTPDGGPRDTAGPDVGSVDMATPDLPVFAGDPIDAPDETWTWVGFDDAVCGNGQPTGIGVNLTNRSDDLFVFMMGGGACWDVNSCFVLNSAANIESGYGEARFDNEGVLNVPAFDRDDQSNPLRDLNWVFVPYCTGDLHAGDKVTTYMAVGQTRDVHHVGSANVRAFLNRLAPTFSDAERVYVSGSSAGGYGAQMNVHQFADAFGGSELHVLSDSGPMLQPSGGRLGEWDRAWTLQTPRGCEDCNTSLPVWYDHLVTTYPDSRFGLLTFDADQTIHLYFGYPAGNSFNQALVAYLDDHVEPAANAEVFALGGTQHVLLGGLTTTTAPGGTSLADWTTYWLEGDDAWTTVRP